MSEITSNYTLVIGDAGTLIEVNNGDNDVVVTVPTNASVAFTAHTMIQVLKTGAGKVSIAPATGVSLNGNSAEGTEVVISQRWGMATLSKIDTDSWAVSGDVSLYAAGILESTFVDGTFPNLSDVANIQTAFYQYHFGRSYVPTPSEGAAANSISWYISTVLRQLSDAGVGRTVINAIGAEEDLDSIEDAGVYYSPTSITNPNLNYPENTAGILTVTNFPTVAGAPAGALQVYQTITSLPGSNPISSNLYYRSSDYNVSGYVWGDWIKIAKSSDLDSISSAVIANEIKTVTTNTYTLLSTDSNHIVRFENSTSTTITVANVLSAGQKIDIYRKSGNVIFSAGSGATLEGAGQRGVQFRISDQYSAATIMCESPGNYSIIGNIEPYTP